MTTTEDIIESKPVPKLRPADSATPKPAQQPAGPFGVVAEPHKPTMRDALVTGLLVIYPAFAAVAAIIAGLFLTSAGSL